MLTKFSSGVCLFLGLTMVGISVALSTCVELGLMESNRLTGILGLALGTVSFGFFMMLKDGDLS